MAEANFRELLKAEFSLRGKKNKSYSSRAFSRDLKVSSGYLSQIFSGQKIPSESVALKMAQQLNWSNFQTRKFLLLIQMDRARDEASKRHALAEYNKFLGQNVAYYDLAADKFRLVADWYHFALLELTRVKDFSSNCKWIAKKLGIDLKLAEQAMERLKKVGLLTVKNGELVKAHENYRIADVSSAAIREQHRQNLEKAIIALEQQDMDLRDFSGATMAIQRERIPEAKKVIKKFMAEMMELLEESGPKTQRKASDVYYLGVQLFKSDT